MERRGEDVAVTLGGSSDGNTYLHLNIATGSGWDTRCVCYKAAIKPGRPSVRSCKFECHSSSVDETTSAPPVVEVCLQQTSLGIIMRERNQLPALSVLDIPTLVFHHAETKQTIIITTTLLQSIASLYGQSRRGLIYFSAPISWFRWLPYIKLCVASFMRTGY